MTALGVALLVLGTALVVAEAHLPGGVLGVPGAVALVAGGAHRDRRRSAAARSWRSPSGVGLGLAAGGWALVAARSAASTRRARVRAGSEGLCRAGRRRAPMERARRAGLRRRCAVASTGRLDRGRRQRRCTRATRVVVERVSGLTLSVRRAEDWELIA